MFSFSRKRRENERTLGCFACKKKSCRIEGEAKAVIMSGNVFVDGQREDKAGASFSEEVQIEVKGNTLPYVSRGGLSWKGYG